MFVRKRKNKTGSISVVVVSKRNGKYIEIKNFGTVKSELEVEDLYVKAKQWIDTYEGHSQLDFDSKRQREHEETERVVGNLDALLINGKQKIAEDTRWDGLKGYITNTDLAPEKVVDQYHGLWVVERAFRVSKGTLDMRPMFHFNPRRIEAHVCICFVAYKVYKELERQIMLSNIPLSVDKVIDIAKTIITMRIRMPENGGFFTKTMFLTDRHRSIMPLFDNNLTQN